jgi:hypothetical protein
LLTLELDDHLVRRLRALYGTGVCLAMGLACALAGVGVWWTVQRFQRFRLAGSDWNAAGGVTWQLCPILEGSLPVSHT